MKRSTQVVLLLMGTGMVGGLAYTAMPNENCSPPNQPGMSQYNPQLPHCAARGSSSSSSSGGSGHWSSSNSSSSSSSNRSYFSGDSSSSGSAHSGSSDGGSHTSRGGFGGFASHFTGGG